MQAKGNSLSARYRLTVSLADMSLGARIKDLLEQVGMSQAELARRVGVRQSTINSLVNGDSRTSRSIVQIARELRTTPAYLTGECDDPAADHPDDQFTSEEREWVELLRTLPTADRRATVRVLRLAAHGARIGRKEPKQIENVQ